MVDQTPFADVEILPQGFSIPELKWRELLFIGALKADGQYFVRDASRPLPAFAIPDLFPIGVRFHAARGAGRVQIEPL